MHQAWIESLVYRTQKGIKVKAEKSSFHSQLASFLGIHGSKFEFLPVGHLNQSSVLRITHDMFFLGIGKDPLNSFLTPLVQFLIFWGDSGRHLQSPRSLSIGQRLARRANYTVVVFVIYISPPLMPPSSSGNAYRPQYYTSVIENLLTDARSLAGRIGNNGLYFGKGFGHTVVDLIKRHAVMYISGG